jgi:cation diffusion facilitator family transporter
MSKLLEWFGFGAHSHAGSHGSHGGHGSHDQHGKDGGHGHTHGVMDATIASTAQGIWAIKWSFVILALTAIFQLAIVGISGSVALLADTIHNVGDAGTAIPLWVAFVLARRKPSARFPYGLGRVEDLAGIAIVLVILFSAIVAGYESIHRLIDPRPITQLGWVAVAGIIGFIGNEAVAVLRIRTGRKINSAALIADGYHARTDGLTSLAVLLGAFGVWLGFPLADPIIGLLITVAIFGIVWQSAKSVFTRMLDGLEPDVIPELRHAAGHVPGIQRITDIKARWIGHKLHADVEILVDPHLELAEANKIAAALEQELFSHSAALAGANIRFAQAEMSEMSGNPTPEIGHGHTHAPEPFVVANDLADGVLEIIDTPDGERMRLTLTLAAPGLQANVVIARPAGADEHLPLRGANGQALVFISALAPAEPHEFDATLILTSGDQSSTLTFHMSEPDHHH